MEATWKAVTGHLPHCRPEWYQKRPSEEPGLLSSPGGSEVTFPFPLPGWYQKGSAKTDKLNKTQILIIPKMSWIQLKSLIKLRTRKISSRMRKGSQYMSTSR